MIFHELGHAWTARFFKQKTRIELAAFGGFTYREGKKLKLWQEFIVVLNGPLMGLLLASIAYAIFQTGNFSNAIVRFLLQFTFTVNLFWTLINLVPVLPLDGGHLMSILLESIFGFKGVKIAIIVGIVCAISTSVFFFIIGAFLIGALFIILTFESLRSLRYYRLFNEKDRDAGLQKKIEKADLAASSGQLKEAIDTYALCT